MIAIRLNGSRCEVAEDLALSDLLKDQGIDPAHARGIAVAVNERIVRRPDWSERILASGDDVEIVTARQGG